MKGNTQKLQIVCAGILLLYFMTSRMPVRIILGEAADQSIWTMIAVGEVIHRREDFEAFSVIEKDLNAFYWKQPWGVRLKAELAWPLSRLTDVSRQATHFENIKKFGEPPWAQKMRPTRKIGDLTFYKEK